MISSNLKRCETFAIYLIENKTTVRKTAQNFGYSKSSLLHYIKFDLFYKAFLLYLYVR